MRRTHHTFFTQLFNCQKTRVSLGFLRVIFVEDVHNRTGEVSFSKLFFQKIAFSTRKCCKYQHWRLSFFVIFGPFFVAQKKLVFSLDFADRVVVPLCGLRPKNPCSHDDNVRVTSANGLSEVFTKVS